MYAYIKPFVLEICRDMTLSACRVIFFEIPLHEIELWFVIHIDYQNKYDNIDSQFYPIEMNTPAQYSKDLLSFAIEEITST